MPPTPVDPFRKIAFLSARADLQLVLTGAGSQLDRVVFGRHSSRSPSLPGRSASRLGFIQLPGSQKGQGEGKQEGLGREQEGQECQNTLTQILALLAPFATSVVISF